MKNIKIVMTTLVLAGSLLAAGAVKAADTDNVVVEDTLVPGDYCHMKFPAISYLSLGSEHPTLASDDPIDFYGRCDETPTSQNQKHEQEQDDFFIRNLH